jgi:hypothetical protein
MNDNVCSLAAVESFDFRICCCGKGISSMANDGSKSAVSSSIHRDLRTISRIDGTVRHSRSLSRMNLDPMPTVEEKKRATAKGLPRRRFQSKSNGELCAVMGFTYLALYGIDH